MKKLIVAVIILALLLSVAGFYWRQLRSDLPPAESDNPAGQAPKQEIPIPSAEREYGVAAGHPLAVNAGMEILAAGGNAVDAAAAVAFALAVVEPGGSGLGGGGIMLIHLAEENIQVVIDYRETAPSTMNKDEISDILYWPSTGIPGFVRGMETAVQRYGNLPFAQVIQPAYSLARKGFEVSPLLESQLQNNSGKIARSDTARETFFRDGWPVSAGMQVVQPQLAETLKNIMAEGSAVFYQGYIADSLIDVLAAQGMQITKQDLTNYQPVVREPISGEYRGYTVVTVPPPAGGFTLLQQLMILEHFDLTLEDRSSPVLCRLLENILRATYSDRRNYIGDPNFVYVPTDELLSEEYIAEKVDQINAGNIPQKHYSDAYQPSDNTTHLVVTDKEGNWVSATNTLSYLFGNGLQAEGFFLNTQLKNFSADPSSPNYYQPGKRPFSHISPTMVFADNMPVLALGSPGGRRIPAFLTQVMVSWVDYGFSIADAVDYPRFWSEDKTLWVEQSMPREVVSAFQSRGYEIHSWSPSSYFGRVTAVYFDQESKQLEGTGDPLRGDGKFGKQ